MQAVKTPDTEPIPGYRLIEPLGRGGYGEVWKCSAPGGLAKAIKFVAANDGLDVLDDGSCAASQELRALQYIKEVRHPFLLSIERADLIDGELVIVMELADRNLHDLLNECRSQGMQGIPREDLLHYLRDAAEALDLLNLEHGLQHLDVKPRNLFLIGRHVKVADFGLVNSLAEIQGNSPNKVQLGAVTPIYAAPENFQSRITLYSDQYSLAISYCEMLTGVLPFSGKNFRQLALQHVGGAPDLSHLPERDRPIVARALAKEPEQRFPSCLDFVQALEQNVAVFPSSPTPAKPVLSLKATKQIARQRKLSSAPVINPTPPPSAELVGREQAITEVSASLSGYHFLECLARMPVGEVWKAQDANGHSRIVKLVFGCQAVDETNGPGATEQLRSLHHETLEPFTVIRNGPNRVAFILDQRDGSLADRLHECRMKGLPGIPREELLKHLRKAAEALDALYDTYQLRHLLLNPRTLLLADKELRIADFGIAELIWLPADINPGTLNPRYSAPELFEGQISRMCDLYSLALIYQELLTGDHPFRNLNPRQLASPRLRGQPKFDLLPASDRPAITRALDPVPEKRFATCTELVTALEKVSTRLIRPVVSTITKPQIASPTLVMARSPLPRATDTGPLVRQILDEAMGNAGIRELKGFRYRVVPGIVMEHHFSARFVPGTLPIKLEGFRRYWIAQVKSSTSTEEIYHISPPAKGFQRWLHKMPTLMLQIAHGESADANALVSVMVTMRPLQGGEPLLEELGPRIIESLRQFLQAAPERRREERFRMERPLRVVPVFSEKEVGEGVVAQPLDVSNTGLGLYLPCRPLSEDILLELGATTGSPLLLPAHIVRAEQQTDGRFLVGATFTDGKSLKK